VPAIIAQQVQFESVAPSHCPFSIRSHAFENLVGIAAQVMTYRNHRGIHKTDTAAFAKRHKLHKEHQMKEHTGHEFHETIIRNSGWEIVRDMAFDLLTLTPFFSSKF
jgi:hypothetical protein